MNIYLLGTSGCHLCDVAEKMLRRLAFPLGFKINKLDIVSSDALVEEYGIKIPVLKTDIGEELYWPFEEEQLLDWLNSLKKMG